MKKNIQDVLPANAGTLQSAAEKTIHVLLEETITERRKLIPQWEQTCMSADTALEKNIHVQLAKTIAQYKREKQYWVNKLFPKEQRDIILFNEKAA